MTAEKLIKDIGNYYGRKIVEHGVSPKGVDWNGEASQVLRFSQLCKLLDAGACDEFSITDYGCGYAALADYLAARFEKFEYLGYDVSAEMIDAARIEHCDQSNVRFNVGSQILEVTDYCLASGVFNVKLEYSDDTWIDYIHTTLDAMSQYASRGFAFNCLTAYSDADKMRDYLYYADPCALFDLCKRRYSRNVALLHDYGLYEFTILVRK
ncbi:methyltransferase domain-containing protein [Methylomonas sp. BW4-1]|uniref:methyltransferase domain-containing protein n=1 Tax=unclassified Methylomonas TaxID=2608980 RepID=UPI001491630F|nr:methyltransferase domain-containing protein [Methylomonas sp. ZR1]NOV30124.1 methyltransferase [Methylomonas sp. ZR1]